MANRLLPVFVVIALAGCASPDVRSDARTAAPLQRYVLLVPLNLNDGSPTPQAVLDEVLDALFAEFGGWTTAGRVRGAYRMDDGRKQVDESLVVWIAIPPDQASALRRLTARFGARLGQETMYLERVPGAVEFVPSTP